jgi:anti-sigma regulatory factor (Ser/Thr protein kinase)
MGRYEISLQPQIDEVPRLSAWVENAAAAEGLGPDMAFRLTLALEEAVTNVIGHAFAGMAPPYLLRVELEVGAGTVTAEIVDNGRAFDPLTTPEPDLACPLEERQPGGLGIHLMRAMTDRIAYARTGGLNRLILVKHLGEAPPARTPGQGR